MDNQHREIKGYRELDEEELSLINEIKEHGEKTKRLLDDLYQYRLKQHKSGKHDPYDTIQAGRSSEAYRALTLAKEYLQTGQMWFVRAVALPDSF